MISAGQRLGVYEVKGPLGSGGMGEVYRATDTRLGREVALKLLPEPFASDADRLARFEREAKLLASLSHTNVATLFGLEEASPAGSATPVRFLVMELVEGEDLSERIARGPLAVDEALEIARQIAEALEEAHEKGIVHRDLKPANVKVSAEGRVKVLDFGLAKAWTGDGDSPQASGPTLSQSPTLAHTGTAAGIILGTAPYMSPEQARGRAVDKRADIWSFGVVLFEMLTGRRVFAGETVSDVLAAVLKTDPDWRGLPPTLPAAIHGLLRRCLERDARRRLHDVADARIVIEDVVAGRSGDGPAAASGGTTGRSRATLAWLAALALVSSAAFLVGYLPRRTATSASPMRLSIQLPAGQEIATGGGALLAFSPDGGTLVFAGREGGRPCLLRRKLADGTVEAIPGTEGGNSPFFSPDGRWVGFIAENRMRKVPAEGGRPFALAEAQGAGGAVWLRDGTMVYAPIYSDGLFRVSADGGTPTRLTTPDRQAGELGHWWPDLLPDGRHVVFTAFRTPVDRSRVGVLDLGTREVRWLVDGGFFGRYVESGHLLYAKGRRLYALPFDAATASARGPAAAVLDDLHTLQTGGFAQLAVSRQGTLAYVSDTLGNPPRELVWLDRKGNATPAVKERHSYLGVSLSPDDTQAALTIQGDSQDLWVLSLARGTLSRLTSSEATEYDARWSSAGRDLFYVVDHPPFELFRIAAGDADSGRPLWNETSQVDTNDPAVSPDGRTIAFVRTEAGSGANVYARPIDGSAAPRAVRATRADERRPCFSPDGRFLAYQSNETGRNEIYVTPADGAGEPVQLTADGGADPVWAADGEVFYRHDEELRVVATRLRPSFSFTAPKTLFTYPIEDGASDASRTFDVTRDGARVLALTIPAESRPREIDVVTGWTAELPRLAPPGR